MNYKGKMYVALSIFILSLILYYFSSLSAVFIHFFLLILGLFVYFLTIDKLAKSSNSPKLKIYFSLVLSFIIFFTIVFVWALSEGSGVYDRGLLSYLLIIPSSAVCFLLSFIIASFILSKGRRYGGPIINLRKWLLVLSFIAMFLSIIFFYNPAIYRAAVLTKSESLCYFTFSSPNSNSLIFNSNFEPDCASAVGSSRGDFSICSNIRDKNYKEGCYVKTSIKTKNLIPCFEDIGIERCSSAIYQLEDEIYNILLDPQHEDIVYAVRSVPTLGFYFNSNAYEKYLPLIKNIIISGPLPAKEEAIKILIKSTQSLPLNEEKETLITQVLPLIENQTELQEYINEINMRLEA